MRFKKSFEIALNFIFHSKLRNWLTVLGIVIGIASIVSIVSLGEGARRTLEENLNSMNANIITVNPGASRALGSSPQFRRIDSSEPRIVGDWVTSSSNNQKNLTAKDVMLIKTIPNVEIVMGTVSGNAEVSYMGKKSRISIQGVDVSVWRNLINVDLESGRYLGKGDVNSVVLGNRIAETIFPDIQVNRQITIEGKNFKVVGILKESGSDDSRIIMPIQSAIDVLDKDGKSFDSISVKISDISITDQTIEEIKKKLMISHNILQENKIDFTIVSPRSFQERINTTMSSMSMFLGSIAGISLIVGSIGIMNSMFTSVLEKTKDIGILKAIGAKNSDILMIFLMNSMIIGLIGGILGIILGVFASGFLGQLIDTGMGNVPFMSRLSKASTYISINLLAEIFVLSIFVGLISGIIPAYRASKLKPVEALRYE